MDFSADGIGTEYHQMSSRVVQIGSLPTGGGAVHLELQPSSSEIVTNPSAEGSQRVLANPSAEGTQRVLEKTSAEGTAAEEFTRSAGGGTEYWSRQDSRGIEMSNPLTQKFVLGNGQCNGLQNLMLGFTSGAL